MQVGAAAPEGYFDDYHTYDEIREYYVGLAAEFPSLATFRPNVGATQDGTEIFGFEFTGTGGPANKPSLFFQCQIHAREWISGATCGYIINHLLENYPNNGTETRVLDAFNLRAIPIINPSVRPAFYAAPSFRAAFLAPC